MIIIGVTFSAGLWQGCATCITLGAKSSQNSGTKKASGAKLICNNRQKKMFWDTTHTYTSHTQIKKEYQQVHYKTTVYYVYGIGNW